MLKKALGWCFVLQGVEHMALSPTDEDAIAALVEQAKEGNHLVLPPTDEEETVALVEQAKEGDHLAFEKLYRLYSDAIYRYLRYMVADDESARDLLQDSFLKAWESLQTLRDAASFRYWLYGIAKNRALNHIRRKKLISWLPWKEDDMLVHTDGQVGGSKPDEWILLRLALEQVQPKYRQCLILQEINGLSQQEIAEIVGIKKSSISQYVKRAYEQLDLAYRRLNSLEKTFLEREYSL
jgi:RNA polymerase sigma-70 factor (ECF subfamily)